MTHLAEATWQLVKAARKYDVNTILSIIAAYPPEERFSLVQVASALLPSTATESICNLLYTLKAIPSDEWEAFTAAAMPLIQAAPHKEWVNQILGELRNKPSEQRLFYAQALLPLLQAFVAADPTGAHYTVLQFGEITESIPISEIALFTEKVSPVMQSTKFDCILSFVDIIKEFIAFSPVKRAVIAEAALPLVEAAPKRLFVHYLLQELATKTQPLEMELFAKALLPLMQKIGCHSDSGASYIFACLGKLPIDHLAQSVEAMLPLLSTSPVCYSSIIGYLVGPAMRGGRSAAEITSIVQAILPIAEVSAPIMAIDERWVEFLLGEVCRCPFDQRSSWTTFVLQCLEDVHFEDKPSTGSTMKLIDKLKRARAI
jgi:hypothetical protein